MGKDFLTRMLVERNKAYNRHVELHKLKKSFCTAKQQLYE